MLEVAVIGGGPAGLRAAQCLAGNGVTLFEQKRSVGRKFLIAGKSGLNLTNHADQDSFLAQYKGTPEELWRKVYESFDNKALREWASSLGHETFVSSGKKVFPQNMKAAPLLRSLVRDVKVKGGEIVVQHSLRSIVKRPVGYELTFSTPEGDKAVKAKVIVLALGGASWPSTGSDGKWLKWLSGLGLKIDQLVAANSGWEVNWEPDWIVSHEGTPWKNLICSVGGEVVKGEVMVTKYGLEGGPIYKLGQALRSQESPVLELNFKPDFSVEQLVKKAESVRSNPIQELSRRWKVHPSILELLSETAQEKINFAEVKKIALQLKNFRLPLIGSRPVEEAISSAGGVCWNELDENLMLRKYPNVYLCGEMVNWEAPTGGFLLQGCFSSATWVSQAIISSKNLSE